MRGLLLIITRINISFILIKFVKINTNQKKLKKIYLLIKA